jgi:hypothetical protein
MFDFLWLKSRKRYLAKITLLQDKVHKNKQNYLAQLRGLENKLFQLSSDNIKLQQDVANLKLQLKTRKKAKQVPDSPNSRKSTGCGKKCYPSTNKARKASRTLGSRIRTYFCTKCNAWHVTSQKIEDYAA